MAAIAKMTLEDAVASVKICKLKAVQHLLAQACAGTFKGKSVADCKPALLKRAAQTGTVEVFAYLVEYENCDISSLRTTTTPRHSHGRVLCSVGDRPLLDRPRQHRHREA